MTGTLLLLYAQPLSKIAALQTTAVARAGNEMRIALGVEAAPVPEPFAALLDHHLRKRPNLRTVGGTMCTPWLFPSTRAGWHIDPQAIMKRLRTLGVNLLGTRNAALQELVAEVPSALVAELLGYSYQVTQRHAATQASAWMKYAPSGGGA